MHGNVEISAAFNKDLARYAGYGMVCPLPWDHVPGTLIHAEAGGLSQTLDGRPYEARSYHAKGLLIAPDRRTWDTLHATLFGDAPVGLVGRE